MAFPERMVCWCDVCLAEWLLTLRSRSCSTRLEGVSRTKRSHWNAVPHGICYVYHRDYTKL
jgi:hypothetical protein